MERPSPDLYQPPLTLWSHAWRLVACLAIGGLVWSSVARGQLEDHRVLLVVDVVLGVVALVLMHWRRRWPLGIALVITVIGLFSGWAGGAATLVAVSLATHRRWPQILLLSAVAMVVGQLFVVVQPVNTDDPWWVTLTTNLTFTVVVVAIGMYIGSRRELLWTLRERAERAESEQELRMDQARAKERERIAREMHDVLGHRISLVTMHAGALAYRTDLPASQVAESARVIHDNAHLAMVELRTVLGVLRGAPSDPQPDRPQPTLADLDQLVTEARASGMRVELTCQVERPEELPEQLGRTVYRIVQEGLTNVRKHAPGVVASLHIQGRPGEGLDIRLDNPLPAGVHHASLPSGFGLVGLTERAELAGGTLSWSGVGRRFVLEVWLPWETL